MRPRFLFVATLAAAMTLACGRIYTEPEIPGVDELTLKEGQEIVITSTRPLSPINEQQGDRFAATLAEPLYVGERLVAPVGSPVEGTIVLAREEVGRMGFQLTRLTVWDGKSYGVATGTVYTNSESGIVLDNQDLTFRLSKSLSVRQPPISKTADMS